MFFSQRKYIYKINKSKDSFRGYIYMKRTDISTFFLTNIKNFFMFFYYPFKLINEICTHTHTQDNNNKL